MSNNTFVVAEMACSHEGDPVLARRIIDGASKAGANAIQLQIWSLIHMMAPQRKEYDLLQRLELSHDEWSDLVKYIRETHLEMQVYVCVYEHASIEFIDNLDIDGYKLNTSDLSNPLVLDKVASTRKPINLSVGASTIEEISSAIERIQNISDSPITLMYGHQSFPTKSENVHMSFIQTLRKEFELPIGYQDHCGADNDSAFWLPAASMGMDVDMLEKHITHDRSQKGVDHESALNPDEFVKFVEMVRIIDEAKGLSIPRPFTADEIKYREFQKKSIVASRDLNKGTVLTSDDLNFMRAETLGYSPAEIDSIIGKVLVRDVEAFQSLEEGDIK